MIPVRVLAVRYLANAAPPLCRALGAPEGYSSLAMLTTDCDDATYIAWTPLPRRPRRRFAMPAAFTRAAPTPPPPTPGRSSASWRPAPPARLGAPWRRP